MDARNGYFSCRFCRRPMFSRIHYQMHRKKFHPLQFGGGGDDMHANIFDGNTHPFADFPEEERQRLLALYRANEALIYEKERSRQGVTEVYNFPVKGSLTPQEVERQLKTVYASGPLKNAFKFNVIVGFIMRNKTTNEYRFFNPESNFYLLEEPISVVDSKSRDAAIRYLNGVDLDEVARKMRPNTKWEILYITQLQWHVWRTNFPLGARQHHINLPPHIRDSHSIQTNFDYEGFENTCMFVCISQFLNPEKRPYRHRRAVRHMVERWVEYCRANGVKGYEQTDPKRFPGVELKDVDHVETCFELNVVILSLSADGSAKTERITLGNYPRTMHVNMWGKHLSLITDFEKYASKYACTHCMRMFKTLYLVKTHQKTCGVKTKYTFTTGSYTYYKSVFERMAEIGVVVPDTEYKRYYTHFICFDMEALLVPINEVSPSGKTQYRSRHQAVSCSIVANVKPFLDPECIIEQDSKTLVENMFAYFARIRARILREVDLKWGVYLRQLRSKVEHRKKVLTEQFTQANKMIIPASERDEEGIVTKAGQAYVKELRKFLMADPLFNQYIRVYKDFYMYMHRVVILHFNGSRYDVPLIIGELMNYLNTPHDSSDDDGEIYENVEEFEMIYEGEEDSIFEVQMEADDLAVAKFLDERYMGRMGKVNVIKRNNAYLCVSNNYYAIMDICNYLPANTNYRTFVKAYGERGDSKSYWPYEYCTEFARLDDPLPPYPSDAWVNSLRGGADILNEELDDWLMNPDGGPKPKSGEEIYAELVDLWNREGFTSLRDLLIHYNNNDVLPFRKCVEVMMKQYFDQKLDLFKCSVSVPGCARILLMRRAQEQNVLFPLIHPSDSDLFEILKSGTVGGPSQIFSRKTKVGSTHVHPDKKDVVRSILGVDCNSLYLGAIKQAQPAFCYIRRFEEEGFKPHFRKQYYKMFIWLEYRAQTDGVHIRTKMNLGREIKAGRYYLDGLAVGANEQLIAFEFLGCFFHKHECVAAGKGVDKDAREKWEEKKSYLIANGYEVRYIWECEWDALAKKHRWMQQKYADMKPEFYRKHPKEVGKNEIMEGVRDGTFYGFLVVDINTPQHLRERYDSFPPLFANTNINHDDLGPLMKAYVEENNIQVKDRRYLMSGFEAREILLSSNLLAFYLKLGLVVTKIYQTVSYVKTYCFESFVDDVTHHRKEAMRDKDKKMIGELFKLIGNSSYGSQVGVNLFYFNFDFIL